jgi:RNA polymerase-interacting CarD/CdnL/TRCF family regulator
MTFRVGDKVVHPNYGAGVVTEIRERHSLGAGKRYYSIELLGDPETTVIGQTHLSCQDLGQVIQSPSGFQPLGLDATLACAFLL